MVLWRMLQGSREERGKAEGGGWKGEGERAQLRCTGGAHRLRFRRIRAEVFGNIEDMRKMRPLRCSRFTRLSTLS